MTKMHLLFIIIFLSIFGSIYALPVLIRLRQIIKSRMHGKGYLCLTYDDGPDNELTTQLIEILEREKVKATFFLVGFRADRNQELCFRLKNSMNEIGCHTYRHSKQLMQFPWNALKDVKKGYKKMEKWILPNAPFRPPRGKTNLLIVTWLRYINARIIWWTHDSCDTKEKLPDPKKVVDKVRRDRGGVVLLHSFHKDPKRHQYVIKVTNDLIKLSRETKMKICTISEYLKILQ